MVKTGNSELRLPEESVALFRIIRILETFYVLHFLTYTLELRKLEEEACLEIPSGVAELSPEVQCARYILTDFCKNECLK